MQVRSVLVGISKYPLSILHVVDLMWSTGHAGLAHAVPSPLPVRHN